MPGSVQRSCRKETQIVDLIHVITMRMRYHSNVKLTQSTTIQLSKRAKSFARPQINHNMPLVWGLHLCRIAVLNVPDCDFKHAVSPFQNVHSFFSAVATKASITHDIR